MAEKHNAHYANITIDESNLDWMNCQNEANIETQASILKTKDTQHYKINATEEELVWNVHKPSENCGDRQTSDIQTTLEEYLSHSAWKGTGTTMGIATVV